MNRFEAIIITLAIDEHDGCDVKIHKYSGRGMGGKETWAVSSELRATDVMGYLAGYLFGKSTKDIAEEILANTHLYPGMLEYATCQGDVTDILAEALESEVEFVKGFSTDNLGYDYVIY